MDYLSEDKIIECINQYIKDKRQKQAILIDGAWGSGKTNFVKKVLIKELKQREKELKKKDYKLKEKIKRMRYRKKLNRIIYISLYGINDVQQISNELYLSMFPKIFENKLLKLISKGVKTGVGFWNIDLDKLGGISDIIDIKNLIIFFDDLERCSININDVLGYINNLVEHNNIKVILIANEKEIGKLNLAKNLEQKYSVVLSDKLNLENLFNKKETKGLEELFSMENKKEKENINKEYTYSDLIRYTTEIFNQDFIYESIKEKLIGQVIKYQPNLENLFKEFVEEYVVHEESKTIVNNNKEKIISIMKKENCYNLRTLSFALMSFEKLNMIICSKNFDNEYINNILVKILIYCIELSICIKNGDNIPRWETDSQAAIRHLKGDWSLGAVYGYKFIDEYLLYNNLDENNIFNTVEKAINEEMELNNIKEESNNALNKLQYFWEMEDEDIKVCIKELKKELENNKYDIKDFKKIAIKIVELEKIGFENEKFEAIKETMKLKAKNETKYFHIDDYNVFVDSDSMKEFNDIINPIREILNNRKDNQNKNNINYFLNEENMEEWGEKFLDYCHENRDNHLNSRKFFYFINIDLLIKRIKESKVKEIYSFIGGVSEIYNFSNLNEFYKSDIENLKYFIYKLDKIDNEATLGINKKFAIDRLKGLVDKFISRIEE